MLDDNLPSYHLRKSPSDPLLSVLDFTHNGSDLAPAYLLKRPAPASARNHFALALFDAHDASVLYGEVLVRPQGLSSSNPSSSSPVSPSSSSPPPPPPVSSSAPTQAAVPGSFAVLLYNPDDSVLVRKMPGGLARPDFWAFEIPERTFKLPSPSALDREAQQAASALAHLGPRIAFHWRRDSRLGRDMTCWMVGRAVGRDGRRGREEPDIPVAMYRAGRKGGGAVSIYEPNMARVEVEDGKGLEVVLLLSAVVVRDLYLAPGPDVFNTAAGAGPSAAEAKGVAGVMPGEARAAPPDAETRRLQALVAEEQRVQAEAQRRRRDEEAKTRRMLEGEQELRRLRQAEVDRETERLRRQYGVQQPQRGGNSYPHPGAGPGYGRGNNNNNNNNSSSSSSNRMSSQPLSMSGALGASRHSVSGGRFFGPPIVGPALPARPSSVAPAMSPQHLHPQPQSFQNHQHQLHHPHRQSYHAPDHTSHANPALTTGQDQARPKLGGKAPRATASVLDLFSLSLRREESEKKKLKKKQSVRF